jgi:diguanylate cyclase (GGDEF)-like protein/putative nucleotidyltransferase with HDIG domain
MSAIPRDLEHPALPSPARRQGLPPSAILYGSAVAAATCVAAMPLLTRLDGHRWPWVLFLILTIAGAVSHLFTVYTGRDSSFHTSWVFVIPAALLLPPELLPLLAIGIHIPEWLKQRYAWYIQSFNICNYTLSLLAAWSAGRLIRNQHALIANGHLRWAIAGLAICAVAIGLNHVLLGPMMSLARGFSLRESGVFSFESLSTDFVLASLGLVVGAFWHFNPWLIGFAVAPLLLLHRSLTVPMLQAEARIDPKTGLYNTRHFASVLQSELNRARRFERPLSLIMADLDLLRDINNTYGHLAGDEVLRGIARVFRQELRHYDVPSRFGGEEFSILLPETEPEEALAIAERVRRAVAAQRFEVETSNEPIRATISMGVASFPRDADEVNELVHHADLAVYRAKLQGRNRVLDAADENGLSEPAGRSQRIAQLPRELPDLDDEPATPTLLAPAPQVTPVAERRTPRPHTLPRPMLFALPLPLALLIAGVGAAGIAAGVAGIVLGRSHDVVGLVAIVLLVGVGQALSLEVEETGSISVGAVGALVAAAAIGPRAALLLALTMTTIEWSIHRSRFRHNVFNVGVLTLASLAAAGVFSLAGALSSGTWPLLLAGLGAGAVYFLVNTGLLSVAVGFEGVEKPFGVWRERFAWLWPHYAGYGVIAAVIDLAYRPIGAVALLVFALPVVLMRKTQETYLSHTQRSAHKLRDAAETIQSQNVSLENANRALKERSTAAMESLSAMVDARDAYTAGHSRRVQALALTIGGRLGLSSAELEVLGWAGLFHDIGKVAIPDAILLKPAGLTDEQWAVMASHSSEGASIISRLGFLSDAVPAIRHHHERYDGSGYPDGLVGEEIPLGARIILVADAFDSMLTPRVYRPERPMEVALHELRHNAGTQFCPRCVAALEAAVEAGEVNSPAYASAQ